MKAPNVNDQSVLEEQASLIASEIFNLLNQYTNDSYIAKFFLTDDIATSCYGLAGGFVSVIYNPQLNPDETKNTNILSFIYALITYGFNIYLKEYSLANNGSPYSLPTDKKVIKNVQRKIIAATTKGQLISTPLADKIILIIMNNIKNQLKLKEMKIKSHRLERKKLIEYSKLSLYWGYNFARGLLKPAK